MTLVRIGQSFVNAEEVLCITPTKDRTDVWDVHFRSSKVIAIEGVMQMEGMLVTPLPKPPPISRGPQRPKG